MNLTYIFCSAMLPHLLDTIVTTTMFTNHHDPIYEDVEWIRYYKADNINVKTLLFQNESLLNAFEWLVSSPSYVFEDKEEESEDMKVTFALSLLGKNLSQSDTLQVSTILYKSDEEVVRYFPSPDTVVSPVLSVHVMTEDNMDATLGGNLTIDMYFNVTRNKTQDVLDEVSLTCAWWEYGMLK